jgi:hypothetical protein
MANAITEVLNTSYVVTEHKFRRKSCRFMMLVIFIIAVMPISTNQNSFRDENEINTEKRRIGSIRKKISRRKQIVLNRERTIPFPANGPNSDFMESFNNREFLLCHF